MGGCLPMGPGGICLWVLGVCLWVSGEGAHPPRHTPLPGHTHPTWKHTSPDNPHGRQTGGTHPTGMLSYSYIKFVITACNMKFAQGYVFTGCLSVILFTGGSAWAAGGGALLHLGPGVSSRDQVHWSGGPGTPPVSSACREIRATSRRYASYWNAFLFDLDFSWSSSVSVGLFCSTPAVAVGRAVPRKVAMEMLFTGQPITAQGLHYF